MRAYIKKPGLLFALSIFFVGQITATPRKTGIPSVTEKPWYTRHKKPLIAGATLVIMSGLALAYYDSLSFNPLVHAEGSNNFHPPCIKVGGKQFKLCDSSAESLYKSQDVPDVLYEWINVSAERHNFQRRITLLPLTPKLVRGFVKVSSKMTAWWEAKKSS